MSSENVETAEKSEPQATKPFAATLAFGSPKEPPASITEKVETKDTKEKEEEKTQLFASKFEATIVDAPKPEALALQSSEKPDEKTKKFASTLMLGSTAAKEDPPSERSEPVNTKRSGFASTMAFGSAETPSPKVTEAKPEAAKKTEPVVVAKAAEPAAAKLDQTEKIDTRSNAQKKADKKNKKKSDSKGTSSSGASGNAIDDDAPITDVVSEKFFSDGDLSRHVAAEHHVHVEDALTVPDKAKRKSDPVVVERRARFVRYVKFAVAGAGILCLAAVARETFTSSRSSSEAKAPPAATTAAIAADPAAPPAAIPVATASAEPTPSAIASADPSAAVAPQDPAAASAVASGSAAPVASAEPPKEEVTGDPKEEKAKCKKALESRKLADAIEAGEKSVALDPTDGEAWLLLGASYQEKGNLASARKAYASCVKEATTGPKYECAKMLR